MSKIKSIVKISILLLYLITELSLTYLKMKVKFTFMKRRWIKEFRNELKKEGVKGEKLNELVKIYQESLKELWKTFMSPIDIARNLRRIGKIS